MAHGAVEVASRSQPVEESPLPKQGVHRVQEAKWPQIWGPPRDTTSPARRWLSEQFALWGRGDLGHRYADPNGVFRETYASTCLIGALLETWADDTPDEATVIAAKKVNRTTWDPTHEVGVLPPARFADRDVIRLEADGAQFVDMSSVRTRTWLARQTSLAAPFRRVGFKGRRLDSGLLEGSGARSRIVTQHVARVVFNDALGYAGIKYRTRLGGQHQNWAIFDRFPVLVADRTPLLRTDPAVWAALAQLGLRLP
jgi:hypothetical protein